MPLCLAGACLASLVLTGCQTGLRRRAGAVSLSPEIRTAAAREPTSSPQPTGDSDLRAQIDGATALAGARTIRRKPRGGWEFVVGLYGWLADTSGTAWADGEREDFEVAFDDFVENTNSGFQAYAEARYRRFFLGVDLTYARTGNEFTVRRTAVDVDVEQLILEFKGGYRLIGPAFGTRRCDPCAPELRCPTLDVFAGVRYWRTDTTIERNFPGGVILPPSSSKFEDREDWADLIFGARYEHPLSRRFSLGLRGDYGGFGFGDSAESTWQLMASLRWGFARRWWAILGWRVMNVDHVTGSGASRNGTDTTQSGPLIGIGLRI